MPYVADKEINTIVGLCLLISTHNTYSHIMEPMYMTAMEVGRR